MAQPSQPPQQPGEGLTDDQQEALVHLGKMMGPQAGGFDDRVQALHDKRHAKEHAETDYDAAFGEPSQAQPHELGYEKMHAAQTGGSTGLGPTEAQQALIKQRAALQQQATGAAAQSAAQAQGGQSAIAPPAAPSGPAGVTQPYPAQKGPQAAPGPAAGQPGPGADEEEPSPGS
jgi:hypothetical protein